MKLLAQKGTLRISKADHSSSMALSGTCMTLSRITAISLRHYYIHSTHRGRDLEDLSYDFDAEEEGERGYQRDAQNYSYEKSMIPFRGGRPTAILNIPGTIATRSITPTGNPDWNSRKVSGRRTATTSDRRAKHLSVTKPIGNGANPHTRCRTPLHKR